MGELRDQLGQHIGGVEHQLLDEELNLKTGQHPTPTVQDLEHTYVAPGRKAQLPLCISYAAHWKNPADGIARHARNQVRALAMTGLPVRLQSMDQRVILNGELTEEVNRILYLEGISSEYTAIAIKHFIFDSPMLLREVICPVGIRNSINDEAVDRILSSTIVYTSWERSVIHKDYVRQLNQLGQVWVPCVANFQAFVSSGVSPEKVRVVPFPYDPEEHTIAAPRGTEDVPEGRRFYHIGKWEPRKNQHRLLGAFLLAFTPKDRASLLIKTSGFGLSWANYPTGVESLDFWMEEPRVKANGWNKESLDRLVRIVDDKLPESQIRAIHEKNNIYVSSGLGEAWDIPAYEAKLAGNRLVYVGYGGPQDYANREDIRVSWKVLEDVHPGYLWEPNAQWAKVSVESLSEALKMAHPPEERILDTSFARNYSLHTVANQMERNVRDLAQKLGCWEKLSSGGFG